MTTETRLTDRQTVFAREYANTGNATLSAKKAGYSEDTAYSQGSRLLKNAEIRKEVDRIHSQRDVETSVTQNFVIQGLVNKAKFAEKDSDSIRAYELLGKHLRMFVDVSESTVHHDTQQLQSFTLAELLALREQALSEDANTQDGEFKVLPESKPTED